MYSVVMMIAFTGAPEMPAFCGRGCRCSCSCSCSCACSCGGRCFGGRRCHGGGGCHCYSGCSGGCGGYAYGGCGGGCGGYVGGGHAYAGGGMMYASNVVTNQAVVAANAPATIVVSLPADAKLTFDGATTNSTSETRRFVTPALGTGDYSYTIAAEVVRDGQKRTTSQTVTVRAGLTTEVKLNDASFTTALAMN